MILKMVSCNSLSFLQIMIGLLGKKTRPSTEQTTVVKKKRKLLNQMCPLSHKKKASLHWSPTKIMERLKNVSPTNLSTVNKLSVKPTQTP